MKQGMRNEAELLAVGEACKGLFCIHRPRLPDGIVHKARFSAEGTSSSASLAPLRGVCSAGYSVDFNVPSTVLGHLGTGL